jgi:hypothetical protein
MGREVISCSTGSNMSKYFATFVFVTSFTPITGITWDLPNLSRGCRHIKLRIYFQPTVPCCTENERARQFLWQAQRPSKDFLYLTKKIFSPPSDSNCQVILQDRMATLVSLYPCPCSSFYLWVSISVLQTTSFFLKSNFLTPNSLYGIRHFHFVPHFTLVHLQRRIQSH